MTDTRPTFARLTEGRATRSWRAALPAVIVAVAVVALVAYLASSVSSSSQQAMRAERDAQQAHEQMDGMTRQIASLQKDDALAKSPGRTTVILNNANPKAKNGAWAAVTWGEMPDGKTFMRVNAYGLSPSLDNGKAYHVWMQPQTGDPVDIGAVDVANDGTGFTMSSALPAIDQGKGVMLTLDASSSKQPGEVVAKADLPKLEPTMAKAPPAAGTETPQAKAGSTSQQMHQGGEKPGK